MPPISQTKRQKISEQIIHHLFTIAPEPIFTNKIAQELARDEEFTKTLLQELEKNQIVVKIKKSPTGKEYLKRARWRLTNKAYEAYKMHQTNFNPNNLYNSQAP